MIWNPATTGVKEGANTPSNSLGLLVYLLFALMSALSYLEGTIKLNNSTVLMQWIRKQAATSLGMLCMSCEAHIMGEKGRKFHSICDLGPVLFLFYSYTFA